MLLDSLKLAHQTSAQPSSEPSAEPTELAPRALNQRVIPAPSLEGKPRSDEPAERELWIYLPPQYFESDAALPVAYYLPWVRETTINGVTMPGELARGIRDARPHDHRGGVGSHRGGRQLLR